LFIAERLDEQYNKLHALWEASTIARGELRGSIQPLTREQMEAINKKIAAERKGGAA
jgi:hypothetical protein